MKPWVLFLEPRGTALEVVRAAARRGYRPVALVTDPTALKATAVPYRSAVDSFERTFSIGDWSDTDEISRKVEELVGEAPVAGVYFAADATVVAGARLRARFGLPTSSAEAYALATDKFRLRGRLRDAGLSRLRNASAAEAEGWTEWPYPGAAYFKPIHGCFSAYVVRIENLSELRAARDAFLKGSPSDPAWVKRYLASGGGYHVEEAIDGELLSVEGLASGGRFQSLGLLSRILYSKNPVVEMGSVFPYPHGQAEAIVEKVRAAHALVGLTEGPSHTEVIVDNRGNIEIVDLNPRFVGADVLQSVNHALNCAFEETLLDWAVGRDVTIENRPVAFACLQYLLAPQSLWFSSIRFPDSPDVRFSTSFPAPGTEVNSHERQLDYLGCYLTVASTFQGALDRSRSLRAQVIVNDGLPGGY